MKNALIAYANRFFKNMPAPEVKTALRELVAATWPNLPVWSSLSAPKIEEVQKASVGCGVLVTFMDDDGVRKVFLAEAGPHYGPNAAGKFTIPGGFATLPEGVRDAAARETGEEIKTASGEALLVVDPARLRPMDTATLANRNGDVSVVIGMTLDLTTEEVAVIKGHAALMENDADFRANVIGHTVNPETNLPEIAGERIFTLEEAAAGNVPLLHGDQLSLFKAAKAHYDVADARMRPRREPTRAFKQKVKTLPELVSLVAQWRDAGVRDVGITSGVFDLLHPGHASFLEDANSRCGRLIAIIASDRTVSEQKGPEKPFITELKRAQTIAAIESVDAVIISDEKFHESILAALTPEIMFKGDDYAGKTIIGADMVGRVELIPCAEKEFYSSSAFARRIKEGQGDRPPGWTPS